MCRTEEFFFLVLFAISNIADGDGDDIPIENHFPFRFTFIPYNLSHFHTSSHPKNEWTKNEKKKIYCWMQCVILLFDCDA